MEKIRLEDFLHYRYLSSPKYAPSGKNAAFIVALADAESNEYFCNLWLYENNIVRQLTSDGKVNAFFWEDDSHILFPAAQTEAEKARLEAKEPYTSFYRINVLDGETAHAFDLPFSANTLERINGDLWLVSGTIDAGCPDFYKFSPEERESILEAREAEKDYEVVDEIPFWFNKIGFRNKKRTALFTYNAANGEIFRFTEPLFSADTWTVLNGKVYYTGNLTNPGTDLFFDFYAYDVKTKSTALLYDHHDIRFYSCNAVDGQVVLLGVKMDRHGWSEMKRAWAFNPETGALSFLADPNLGSACSVLSDCQYGGGDPVQASAKYLYFTASVRNAGHLLRLGLDGTLETVVGEEGAVNFYTVDKQDHVLTVALRGSTLQELYAYPDGKETCVTSFNTDILKNKYVAAPHKLTVHACGWDIDGWVLLPKDYDASKKYPAVLDIHGGPCCAYGEVFFHEMQLWASEGYFVFFCNPYGSDGRGDDFADMRGNYGDLDYSTLMGFTDAVLEQWPAINRNRVAVTGGSYGGYMTNWIVGHTDRFVCAATQRSISNWITMYGISDTGYFFGPDQCTAHPLEDYEKSWDVSPLKYARSVKTPTLFIHSSEDYRCPLSEAVQFFTALTENGVETRMCIFKGENHELSRSGKPTHRVRRLKEITNWFEKFCK